MQPKPLFIINVSLRYIALVVISLGGAIGFVLAAPQPWAFLLCVFWGYFMGTAWRHIWPRRPTALESMAEGAVESDFAEYRHLVPAGYEVFHAMAFGEIDPKTGDKLNEYAMATLLNKQTHAFVGGQGPTVADAIREAAERAPKVRN